MFWAEDNDTFGIKISSWHSGCPHSRSDRYEYRHGIQSWQLSRLSKVHKFSD